MEVSVVVPTRDRPEKLERCLRALAAQTATVEVVVVDDGSNDGGRVASIVTGHGGLLVRLEGGGPAAARNAGVAASGGGIVCFTDDDCEPDPDWAAMLMERISAGEAIAAGRTLVDGGAADRAWQAIADHLQHSAASPGSPSPGFAPTCNLACSRELLERIPFDESFPDAAGEDRDWAARAVASGGSDRLAAEAPADDDCVIDPTGVGSAAQTFVADAIVVHRPDLTPVSFLRQQYRYGRGAARYHAAARGRRLGSPSFYAGLLAAGFREGIGPGLLVCTAQLATVLGVGVEVTARAAARLRARSDRHR
jgi:glycosyltransferase involved in cell wall biosynthesis